jgi:hypothetical protein
LGLLSLLFLNSSIEAATPLANSGKTVPNKKVTRSRVLTNPPISSIAADSLSRWYNMGETMDEFFQGTSVLVPNYLFPDSNILAEFGVGEYSSPFVHILGDVLDVRSSRFNDDITYPTDQFLHITNTDSYKLDSIQFLFAYERNINVTDSLIFEVVVNSSNAQLPEYFFTGMQANFGVDTLSFKALKYTYQTNKLNMPGSGGATKRRYAIALNEQTLSDTITGGFNIVQFSTANLPVITAGKFVVSSVVFKPGYNYSLIDTLNSLNSVSFFSYEEQPDGYPLYVDGDYNCSHIVPTDVRYNLDPSWNGFFIPSYAYTAPYGFEHHLIYYKIRKNLPCNTAITATNTVNAQATCGLANGSATVSATGGETGNYQYFWPNGITSATASNLAPGTYSVVISDGQNCSITNSVTITSSTNAATLTSSTTTPTTGCNTLDGTATAVPTGGTAPYTYLWSTGNTTDVITAGVGTYSVTVTTADGCTSTRTLTIASGGVPASISVSNIQPTSACNSNDGVASITATGGDSPYTYLWSNGQTSASITAGSGSYSVVVTTAGGCTSTGSLTISQGAAPNAAAQVSNVACFGGNTGSIALTYSGLNPTFQWYTSAVVTSGNQISGQTNATLSGRPAGTFTCVIVDANTCKDTITSVIGQPPVLSVSVTAIPNSTANNGSATANVSGGIAPYTYLWSNGETSPTISNLATGTYSVTVTDQNSCTKTFDAVITGINERSAEEATFNMLPNPATNKVTIEYTADKAVPATVRLVSINGQEVYSENFAQAKGKNIQNIDISGLAKGVYFLQLRSENANISKKLIKN